MVQPIYRDWQCGKDIPWVAQTIKLRCGSCLAGFHMEPQGVHLLSKSRFKDALINCMQNSSEKPTSRIKQLQAVQKLMAHNKQLTLQFATDMWTEILEPDNSIHTVFTDEAKFTGQDMSVNINVSFEVVSNQENIKDMNGIVLKWKRHWPKLHWWGHHYKQFIPTLVGELCSSSAQQQTQSYNSSIQWGNCSICSHYLWVNMNFLSWWTESKDLLCSHLVLLFLCLWTLLFGATWTTQCIAKWWVQ